MKTEQNSVQRALRPKGEQAIDPKLYEEIREAVRELSAPPHPKAGEPRAWN